MYRGGAGADSYGEVVISASPAPSLSFRSEASWPAESYESRVRRGIIDALDSSGLGSDFGAEFVLEEVVWHDADSCGDGYYNAAKQAAEEILKRAAASD